MKKVLVLVLALMLSACSEPRIDSSSDEALKDSFQRVRKTLESADREALDGYMASASAGVMMSGALGGGVTLASQFEPMDGMTGEEAAAWARELEAENDAALKKLEAAQEELRAARREAHKAALKELEAKQSGQ